MKFVQFVPHALRLRWRERRLLLVQLVVIARCARVAEEAMMGQLALTVNETKPQRISAWTMAAVTRVACTWRPTVEEAAAAAVKAAVAMTLQYVNYMYDAAFSLPTKNSRFCWGWRKTCNVLLY